MCGTVDENRNGVPLALPVRSGLLWIFVDDRHSPKYDSALPGLHGIFTSGRSGITDKYRC